MLDFPLMLQVKLPVVDRIYPQSDKFATGVENKGTGDSKHNGSPGIYLSGRATTKTMKMQIEKGVVTWVLKGFWKTRKFNEMSEA